MIRTFLSRAAVCGRILGLTLLLAPLGAAAAAPDEARLHATVRSFLVEQTRGLPGEVRITIDPLDPRHRLAQCQSFAPSVPAGTRLWGRSAVAVRCLGPSAWEIFLPVHIQVFANHLRTTRRLPGGQRIGPADLDVVRDDLTALPDGVLTDPAQAIGLRLRLGVAEGLPLLKEQLIIPPAIRQGQTVRLVARGQGFAVSSEGTALANAAEGAQVPVRTAGGQTVRGRARADGVVEIDF